MEGFIFGGAYVRREICVSKSIGLGCSGRETYHFCFVLLCIRGPNSKYKPPAGLIFGGAIKRRVFCVTILKGLYLEGLIHRGPYFRNFTVCWPAEMMNNLVNDIRCNILLVVC